MRYLEKITTCALLAVSVNVHAGFHGTTVHSRANCVGFNESITWNWNEYHWWEVESVHFLQKGSGPSTHQRKVWMAYTWRAAAYDFMQDPAGPHADKYWVQGYHFTMAPNGAKIYDAYTQAGDCSIYDGWWDKNKANGV